MNKLSQIFSKTKYIFTQYPMILSIAFLLGVSLVTLIDLNRNTAYEVSKVSETLALGISLFFGIKMLSQRIGKTFLLQLLGLAILGVFYFALPKSQDTFDEIEMFWIIPSFILTHLLVAFIPFLRTKTEINFWEYNKNLFINFILTLLFSGVLIGGIELAILAIEKLFMFNFDGDIYGKTFLFLSTFGSCFIFLTFNKTGLPFLEKKGDYPIVLKFFTQFILIPLLLIYVIILYVYSAKILLKWELPRGWVSYLILAYSIVGVLALLLVHPLKNDTAKSWVKVFSKVFYYTLIPLLILLYTAIFTRILEYGYTEARYFVLLIAIWLTSVVFYFIAFRKASIKFIPISLFSFGLFAIIMPYFNTFSVAKRSQESQFVQLLNDQKLLENGKINFNKKISHKLYQELRDKIRFLHKREHSDFVFNYVNDKVKKEMLASDSKYEFVNNFSTNFKYVESLIDTERNREIILESSHDLYDIKGYDYALQMNNGYSYKEKNIELDGDQLTLVFKKGYYSKDFEIIVNDTKKVNFTSQIRALFKGIKVSEDRYITHKRPEISTEVDVENYHIKVCFNRLVLHFNEDNSEYYTYNKSYVFIKKK